MRADPWIKTQSKSNAVWARRELITRVSQRAAYYEITEENTGDPAADTALERPLTPEEKTQRRALIENIRAKGYREVMEEIAYTWFNRFIALRFMEVNGYLPSHVRCLPMMPTPSSPRSSPRPST